MRRPPRRLPAADSPAGRRGRTTRTALLAGLLCIAACEYSQLAFVSPSAASSLGMSGRDLLARAVVTPDPGGPRAPA